MQLLYPVTVGGQEVTTLDMRRPKVKDDLAIQAMGKSEGEREVMLFAVLCGVGPEVIRELDQGTDYTELQRTYEGFFGLGTTTSGSPARS